MTELPTSIKRVELAKVGTFGANQTEVTEKDLLEIEQTFEGDAPIVLGHAMARKDSWPRFGRVLSVTYHATKKQLVGDIELNELLTDAWNRKFYTKWSIGARTNAEGKRYLHHLALLGAIPPGIKDLKVIKELQDQDLALSDISTCDIWQFSDEEIPPNTQQTNTQKHESTPKPQEDANKRPSQQAQAETQQHTNKPEEGNTMPEPTPQAQQQAAQPTNTEANALPNNAQASVELADTQTKLAQAQAQLKAVEQEKLQTAIQGKIPKDAIPKVLALADAIPTNTIIELSDIQDGIAVQSKKTGYQLIADIFAAIPTPVQEGRLNLSDPSTEEPATAPQYNKV